MPVAKGQQAPNFSLKDTEKNLVSLEEFRGRPVVVLFFPLAFTGICTTELCTMRDDLEQYNELDAKVLAISVDSLFTLGKFKEVHHLNFPLLSDFNKEAMTAYGCTYEEFVHGMKGVAKRSVFVVDKNGIVQHAEILEDAPNLPNFQAIKDTLKQLQGAAAEA